MIVRQDQCAKPKCKGCGMHIGTPHEPNCIIALSEAFRNKRKAQ